MNKLNKILNYTIIVAILFLIVKSIYENRQSAKVLQQPKYEFAMSFEDAKKYYPEADSISLQDISLYHVFENEILIGKILNTSPFCDQIYGYNGIVPLTIFFDEQGKIFEMEVCENKESRPYINKVINSNYLDLWDGLGAEEALNLGVDAVSGCTYTSRAISLSVRTRLGVMLEQEYKQFTWDWKLFLRQLSVLIVTILALVCFFNPKKTALLRKITLLLSIFIIGFWNNSLLSIALFYNWIANGLPSWFQLSVCIIAILSLLLPLITSKSFYCQYVCPFGALQEFAGMIGKKKVVINAKVFRFFSLLRRLILLVLFVLSALGIGLDLSALEPFPVFNYQAISFGVGIFAAVILIVSLFINKPWCNFLCPTGTLLDVFRRLKK